MDKFFKKTIEKTFNRCIGLQSALQTAVRSEDSRLKEGALSSLAHQSGLRRLFIEEHLTEILAL